MPQPKLSGAHWVWCHEGEDLLETSPALRPGRTADVTRATIARGVTTVGSFSDMPCIPSCDAERRTPAFRGAETAATPLLRLAWNAKLGCNVSDIRARSQ